jgi:ZIP family zinc transporter
MTAFLVMAIALATAAATLLGGLLAISLKHRLPLVLAFSAGAVIGVAFFDLMPEAIAAAAGPMDARALLGIAALGFFFYALLDRMMGQHDVPSAARGRLGAASFSLHSMLDGFVLGIAFQAGHEIGLVVAAAILAHDFADGLNTVNVVVKNGGTRRFALAWLVADALAPVLGAAISLLVRPQPELLCILLALFAGFFLYIGAADLLPESNRGRPRLINTLATFAGAGLLYLATRLV